MRPDSIKWQTSDMVALKFTPRRWLGHSVTRRFTIGLLVMAGFTLATLVTLQGPWRAQYRGEQGRALTNVLAQQVERAWPARDTGQLHSLLSDAVASGNLAFAAVLDAQGNVIANDTADQALWERFKAKHNAEADREQPRQVHVMTRQLGLVHRVSLEGVRPTAGEQAAAPALYVAVRDVSTLRALADGGIAVVVGGLLALGVVLPLMRRYMHRETEGLRDVLDGLRHLAEGHKPQPVPVRDNGELGYLSVAFNDMASKLLVSQEQLLEANRTLEKRVDERTRELREAAHKLDAMASTDALTKIANRRALNQELEHRFKYAAQDKRDLICLLIDLDNFKTVNDELGHQQGDELLVMTAEILQCHCRDDDFPARLGGDEFVVVLTTQELHEAARIADRMLNVFAEKIEQTFADQEVSVQPSMSIGMASRRKTGAISAEELLIRADRALYSAKGQGKGCVQVYESES